MSGGDVIELDESSTAVAGQAKNQLAATPAQLLQIAVQNGADLDKLERLMALQERWEANQAAQAFAQAMAAFKAADAVRIVKDKHVRFQSQKGITEYDHATIGNVVKVITEALAPHGLSHSWTTRQEGGEIHVTCKLRHRGGHFEEVTLSGNPDPSGGKNPIQAIGSTVTYLQRYTLLLITGCATSDQPDDDGRSASDDGTEQQTVDARQQLIDDGRAQAMEGMQALTAWWGRLTAAQRKDLTKEFGAMRRAAMQADRGGAQ